MGSLTGIFRPFLINNGLCYPDRRKLPKHKQQQCNPRTRIAAFGNGTSGGLRCSEVNCSSRDCDEVGAGGAEPGLLSKLARGLDTPGALLSQFGTIPINLLAAYEAGAPGFVLRCRGPGPARPPSPGGRRGLRSLSRAGGEAPPGALSRYHVWQRLFFGSFHNLFSLLSR